MKKIISAVLAAAMLMAGSVLAAGVKSFSDVPKSHWGYGSIMAMTEKGYFNGKGDIVNGVGVFKPNDTMTRAEFLTVVARIAIGEENIAKGGMTWWKPYVNALEANGIVAESMFGDMNAPMTREEMAYVSIAAAEYLGEVYYNEDILYITPEAIPDFNSITSKYMHNVTKAYYRGILKGVDSNGTFSPKGNLTRAAATAVLYRIIDEAQRV